MPYYLRQCFLGKVVGDSCCRRHLGGEVSICTFSEVSLAKWWGIPAVDGISAVKCRSAISDWICVFDSVFVVEICFWLISLMPRVDKRKKAAKAVVISSDESHYDDSESSENFFDGVSKIAKKMKKKFISSSSDVFQKHKAKKAKGVVKSDGSFSRFSAKYFRRVVSSLSPHQMFVIEKDGFKNLLLFDSGGVPKKFAAWISSKVDLKTSEIILKDRVIPITVESFRDILGLPFGGLSFGKDLNLLSSYDWCKFVYDWCMNRIKKFQKSKNLGGCLYYWAVSYLDNVDFGERNVPIGFPRMSVWKEGMIKRYSDFDKIDDDTFGLRPPRVICSTSNSQPAAALDEALSFRLKLNSVIGEALSNYLKDMICTILKDHCQSIQVHNSQSLQDFVISLLKLLHDESVGSPIQSDENAENNQTYSATAMESDHAEVHNSTDHIDVGDDHVLDANAHNQFASGAVQNEQQTSPCCNHDVDSYVPLENDLPDNVPLAGNFDNAGDFNCASGYLPSMNTGNASTSVVDDGIAESFGQALVTPDVGYAKNFKNSSDERFSASAIATAAAVVKHVAIKFKSRLPQFNGSENVDRAVDMFKPSYKNLFPQDNVCDSVANKSFDMDKETDGNVTPSSSQAGISFHSVEDTPEELIQIKHNREGTARTPNSGIIKKRVFEDLVNSPDLIIVGESKFHDRCNNMTAQSDLIYNASILPTSTAHHEQLVVDPSFADAEKVQKSFEGAAKARRLDLCDMLFFPIHYQQHWFLFIVDVKDRMFVFLDSKHEEHSEFYENLKTFVVDNFQNLWNKFVGSSLDFSVFKTVFPLVPRQDYESDSGVFVMKFMEIWSPRILLPNEFSKQNINNIQVKYVNQIFFHAKNKMLHTEIEDAVLNWFNPEKFARQ
uniref:Ubiquitin-like protease family profile domain-containing protein n=1 Tax=Oryza glumipatula TaxID=40148 RepID=A0A0E0A7M6_9ORYZ